MNPDLLLTLASLLGCALLGASAAVALRGPAESSAPLAAPLAAPPVEPAEAPVVAPEPEPKQDSPAPDWQPAPGHERLLELAVALRSAQHRVYATSTYIALNRWGWGFDERAAAASMAELNAKARDIDKALADEMERLAEEATGVYWFGAVDAHGWHCGLRRGPIAAGWAAGWGWGVGMRGASTVYAPTLPEALRLLAEQSPKAAEAVRALGVSSE